MLREMPFAEPGMAQEERSGSGTTERTSELRTLQIDGKALPHRDITKCYNVAITAAGNLLILWPLEPASDFASNSLIPRKTCKP